MGRWHRPIKTPAEMAAIPLVVAEGAERSVLVRYPTFIREVFLRKAVVTETTRAAATVSAWAIQDSFVTFLCDGQDLIRVRPMAEPVTSARV